MPMNFGSLPGPVAVEIDRVCDDFEAAWREGRSPRIEDYLSEGPESNRSALLRAMIAAEVELRQSDGESPVVDEYLARFPSETLVVREVFEETERDSNGGVDNGRDALLSTLEYPVRVGSPTQQETPVNPPARKADSKEMPKRIGPYKTLDFLGEGGFGRVYLARHFEIDRTVAIKVARLGILGTREREENLIREARLAAALKHPAIVTVFEVGKLESGEPFVVFEHIEGQSLAKHFKSERFEHQRLARLLARVAEAIHYAHLRGLIHRDLTPSNILVDAFDEPHITDFGLAVNEDLQRLRSGEVAGTPSYMAPEQVRGVTNRLDGRTDVWALGVILYRGLTGRLPFNGQNRQEIFEEILERDPKPPRQFDEHIPRELEQICLACLAKRISDRYGSAVALAEDLRDWLEPPAVPSVAAASVAAVESPTGPAKVAPKGLRPFDRGDAELFMALMPGPRGKDNLPESLRFWRSRIDGTPGGAEPFSVGLLYGPSGGGKSSFLNAGLLPRLDPTLNVVRIDATPEGTEPRLLAALCREVPGMSARDVLDADLAFAVSALRSSGETPPARRGRKTLIVIDQFEQWLQAHPAERDCELILGLRQCDGQHVQALLLVRDDFWMAVTRFFRALEIPLAEGVNSSPVELPDARHARTVLEAFGRACGRFTGPGDEPSDEEGKFLDEAVAGLAETDGRVIPARLSLLAEVVRNRPWTPATLKELGGVGGIGVTFLTETFDAPTSPPSYHAHRVGAGSVLQALLPPPSSVLKAAARPVAELCEAARAAAPSDDFRELLRILDQELKLISVVDTQSSPSEPFQGLLANGPYYQLAHDDLVEPIRQWVERKEQSSRTGRARLRLGMIAFAWKQRPVPRSLPSLPEWVSILAATRPARWTADEWRMMRAATFHHVGHGLAALAMVGATAFGVREIVVRDRVSTLAIRAVTAADPAHLKAMMPEVFVNLDRVLKGVEAIEANSTDVNQRRNAGLIAYHGNPTAARADAMIERIPVASSEEIELIRDALTKHPQFARVDRLHNLLHRESTGAAVRLRTLATLAKLRPEIAAALGDAASPVALALVNEERRTVQHWVELLDPALPAIAPHLKAFCNDPGREPALRSNAAEAFGAIYAKRREPAALALAAVDARPDAGRVMIQELKAFNEPAPALDAFHGVLNEADVDPANEIAAERVAIRKAKAAVALAVLGETRVLLPLLKHAPDPRVRARLIQGLARSEVAAEVALPLLKGPRDAIDPAQRQALWLALAEADRDAIAGLTRDDIAKAAALSYVEDPDAGVHSASWLLLRRWGRDDLLEPADRTIRLRPPIAARADRGWFVGPNNHTFLTLKGPLTFTMGSPDSEADRFERETPHVRRIDRSLAVSTTEVTDAQFRLFRRNHKIDPRYGDAPENPAREITWYEAAAYCNWLSGKAGLEPCYPEPVESGMVVADDILGKPGFRLPTEAEWEYVCRGETVTARPSGSSDELLPRYAWTWLNSNDLVHPAATLLPNEFGLFDVIGNVWEWTNDGMPPFHGPETYPPYPKGTAEAPALDTFKGDIVKKGNASRILRGGGYSYAPSQSRSAMRYTVNVELGDPYIGFRVVRTLP